MTIKFSQANLDLFTSLLKNDSALTDLGLGFGPDCHFYDKKITLTVTTVPDTSATIALLAFAMLGLAGTRRFVKKS